MKSTKISSILTMAALVGAAFSSNSAASARPTGSDAKPVLTAPTTASTFPVNQRNANSQNAGSSRASAPQTPDISRPSTQVIRRDVDSRRNPRNENRRDRPRNDNDVKVRIDIGVGQNSQTSTQSSIITNGNISSTTTYGYPIYGYPAYGYPYYNTPRGGNVIVNGDGNTVIVDGADGYPYYDYYNPRPYVLNLSGLTRRYSNLPTAGTSSNYGSALNNPIPTSDYYFYPQNAANNGGLGYDDYYGSPWNDYSAAYGNNNIAGGSSFSAVQESSYLKRNNTSPMNSATAANSSAQWAGGAVWSANADGKAATIPVWSSATSTNVLDANAPVAVEKK